MRQAPEAWDAWAEMLSREGLSETEAISRIQMLAGPGERTQALRTFLLNYYRAAATEEGHKAAGHGGADRLEGMMRR
jgi:hypothetical protein